jgi:hypothetical protein
MKYLALISILGLMACAQVPNPPESQLSGFWTLSVNMGQITFYSSQLNSGTFVYQNFQFPNPNPFNNNYVGCSQTGTWLDLNPGSIAGQVVFTVQFDTCNDPAIPENTTVIEYYTKANNQLFLNMWLTY